MLCILGMASHVEVTALAFARLRVTRRVRLSAHPGRRIGCRPSVCRIWGHLHHGSGALAVDRRGRPPRPVGPGRYCAVPSWCGTDLLRPSPYIGQHCMSAFPDSERLAWPSRPRSAIFGNLPLLALVGGGCSKGFNQRTGTPARLAIVISIGMIASTIAFA